MEVAREETLADIRRQIHDAVEAEFDRQKADISGRLAAEAEKIDMEALKRDVTKKAEEAVLKRFYEMGGIPKIYGAFNGMMDRMQGLTPQAINDILDQFTFDTDKKRVLELLLGNGNNNGRPF